MIKMNEEEDLLKIKEFDENQLSKLISDLRDINSYTSFKNGSFIYDLGKYQGNLLINYIEQLQNNWNELNKFIEEEKNRLATQVSNTYKDSLDKIHFVNEDIFNELAKVSEKMQELERGKE